MPTKIEWTDETWNPIRGCSRVSEGCRNCYAEAVAYRFSGPGQPYEGLVQVGLSECGEVRRLRKWNGAIKFVEEHLLDPLKWKRPRRVFVNSMSDLFHENVTDEMRDRIFAVMALSPQHTFQVLTKRPERMLAYLQMISDEKDMQRWINAAMEFDIPSPMFEAAIDAWTWPLPNVWLGVSVENQKAADERIPLLLQTPAAVRFISAEPLLGEVLLRWPVVTTEPKLDWVICGGESGPGARPMHPDWARGLRDQCVAAGVPFFFKQWGEWVPWQPDGGFSEWKSQAGKLMDRHGIPDLKDSHVTDWSDAYLIDSDELCVHQRVGKKSAGHLLDGVEWHQFPAVR